MQYTVWSRGELIGSTELGFRGVGYERCRSGHFLPTARGKELMEELASDSHCMRAFMHRDFRDDNGNDLLDPEYVNSDWFADVAEHLHAVSHYKVEMRDEQGVLVPLSEIGIQDKHPDWPPPASPEQMEVYRQAELARIAEHEQNRLDRDVLRQSQTTSVLITNETDENLLDELILNDSEQMEGGDYYSTPCDITMPVGWEYEDHQGDNELGSGWNTTLRDLPTFPRYQVHVILA